LAGGDELLDFSKPTFNVDWSGMADANKGKDHSWTPDTSSGGGSEESPLTGTAVSEISIDVGPDLPVNYCKLILSNPSGADAMLFPGDTIKVSMGYLTKGAPPTQKLSLAFTGTIWRVENGVFEIQVEATSSIRALIEKKCNIVYSDGTTADKIIERLVNTLGGVKIAAQGIDVSEVTKTLYQFSDNYNLLEHTRALAQEAGHDTYMDCNDEFQSREWKPTDAGEKGPKELYDRTNATDQVLHTLKFNRDIISWEFQGSKGPVSKVELINFRSSGEEQDAVQIEPTWSISEGEGGGEEEGEVARVSVPHVSRKVAATIATNLLNRISGGLIAQVKISGAPQIRLGDGVKFEGLLFEQEPFKASSETPKFHVRRVVHTLNTDEGFLTRLVLQERSPSG